MPELTARTRKPLNPKQLHILKLLYKFRFGTVELFTQNSTPKVSRQFMNRRLYVLLEQEYIGRRYDGRDRLRGEAARYHLLSKGVGVLKADPELYDPKVLRNAGRDKSDAISEQFMRHSLGLFEIYTAYAKRYGEDLLFATKSNLTGRDAFPQPLPDAYAALRGDESRHCFVESFESSTQFFIIKKRIKYYAEFAEDNELPKSRPLPGIVFICDDEKLKKKVEDYTRQRFIASWKKISFAVYAKDELTEAKDLFEFGCE